MADLTASGSAYLQGLASSNVGAATSKLTDAYNSAGAQLQSQMDAAATPQASAQRETNTAAGIMAVANGKQPSEAQIEAGITTAAVVGTALATGMSMAAAGAALGPIGAVVFGLGALMSIGVESALHALGWMKSDVSCSKDDPATKVSGPDDPKWRHWKDGPQGKFKEFSAGSFEDWARPIMVKMLELEDNCRKIPGGNAQAMAQGIVATWNSHAPPGTKMRTIKWHLAVPPSKGTDLSWGSPARVQSDLEENDPIQQLIRQAFAADQRNGIPAVDSDPTHWQIQVANVPPPPPTGDANTAAAKAAAQAKIHIQQGLTAARAVAAPLQAQSPAAATSAAVRTAATIPHLFTWKGAELEIKSHWKAAAVVSAAALAGGGLAGILGAVGGGLLGFAGWHWRAKLKL